MRGGEGLAAWVSTSFGSALGASKVPQKLILPRCGWQFGTTVAPEGCSQGQLQSMEARSSVFTFPPLLCSLTETPSFTPAKIARTGLFALLRGLRPQADLTCHTFAPALGITTVARMADVQAELCFLASWLGHSTCQALLLMPHLCLEPVLLQGPRLLLVSFQSYLLRFASDWALNVTMQQLPPVARMEAGVKPFLLQWPEQGHLPQPHVENCSHYDYFNIINLCASLEVQSKASLIKAPPIQNLR